MDAKHRELLKQLRQAMGDYVASEGCGCCRDSTKHAEAAERLGKLMHAAKFSDGSGYDFWKYRSAQT